MKEEKNNSFDYEYSSGQEIEIAKIRAKYLPKEESKMETLRKLDKSVERPGMITGIALGVLGCLVLGTGMSCVMVWTDSLFWVGIVVGIIGLLMVALAYPMYAFITKRRKEKMAPQILALTEELRDNSVNI